ncbi:hypothetical protein SAMN05421666_3157 [Roseovarius nanhaiticus]|uniref:O-Antigen ligase n=1 Tax=Roseovarius nanhaiticus TaxID=573024 RepID=A0A1N7HIR6_9RHOB|nr:hypothetical protein [Roseovarius nanhaiticus]SEK91777.1 hypothetical protein SAMN05216208_2159 [Roseovarius nanhaiticus]SIS24702.1 hypothetical protein SAMN05421666_3157 [Roseovarius nanhaiticus]
MPNALAYLMLAIWPLVCVMLVRRLPAERAIIWCILGGYLVLPPATGFDLPLVPEMNKVSIPNICAFVLAVFYLRHRITIWSEDWAMRVLVLLFVLGVVPTVLTNGDAILFTLLGETAPIVFSAASLPGLGLRDLLSVIVGQVIVLLPFFLGRSLLSSETGLRELLIALVIGALAYSIPALVEIRLSPQINTWVYGFFQHDFEQMMRQGGFRPIVFLPHALWLAFFIMTAAMAAIALSRSAPRRMMLRYLGAALYLLVVLVLCKSIASLLYALMLAPVLLFGTARLQVRLAFVFALIAMIYPMLRNNGYVPTEAILAKAETYSTERAQSLGYRFDNEELLLDRADAKPLFGWGGWGRNLVRDPQSGEILTIPDGEWIIVFGTFGWVGYIAQMGLIGGPLILLWWRMGQLGAPGAGRNLGKRGREIPALVAPIAVLLSITMIDMLLNAILTPYTWLMAGAILGACEAHLRAPLPAKSRTAPRRRVVIGDTGAARRP